MPETIALRRLGGRFLRELREDRGYSQATLAKAVGYLPDRAERTARVDRALVHLPADLCKGAVKRMPF